MNLIPLLLFATLTVFASSWYTPPAVKWLAIALSSSICWLGLAWEGRRGSLRIDPIDAVALLLLVWVAISVFWSADPLAGKDTVFRWAMLTSVFWFWRRRTLSRQTLSDATAIAAGIAVVMGFLILQVGDSGGYYNRNMVCETLLAAAPFLYPLAIAARGTRWRWAVSALAIAIGVYLLFFNSSKIKFAAWSVLAVFLVLAFVPHRSRRMAAVVLAACFSLVLVAIILGWENLSFGEYHGFRSSFLPRAELTIDSILVWLTRPFTGVGAGGFNAVLPLYKDAHVAWLNISGDAPFGHGLHQAAEAAHNDLLQFLANFGLVGIVLEAVGIYVAWKSIAAWRTSPERTAGLLVVLTVLTNALLEFPLQTPATLLLFTVGLAWLLPAPCEYGVRPALQVSGVFGSLLVFLAAIAVAVNLWWSWSYFRGHDALATAVSLNHVDRSERLLANRKAVEAYPYEPLFRRQYLITLMDWDFASDARVVPPEEYDRIFEVASTAGLETGTLFLRLHYLITSDRYRERPEEFRRLRNLLLSQSSRFPETWILEGILAVRKNDRKQLEHALARYATLTQGETETRESQAAIISVLHAELARLAKTE